MSARAFISVAPGFSRAFSPDARTNRFNGLSLCPAETVETVPASTPVAHTWLKPGANESSETPAGSFPLELGTWSFFGAWNLGFGAFPKTLHPAEVT